MRSSSPTLFENDNKISICLFWEGNFTVLNGDHLQIRQVDFSFDNYPQQKSLLEDPPYLQFEASNALQAIKKDILQLSIEDAKSIKMSVRVFNNEDQYADVAVPLDISLLQPNSHYNLVIYNTDNDIEAKFIPKGQPRTIYREKYSTTLYEVLGRVFFAALGVRIFELKLLTSGNQVFANPRAYAGFEENTAKILTHGLLQIIEELKENVIQNLYAITIDPQQDEIKFMKLFLSQPEMAKKLEKWFQDVMISGCPTATKFNCDKVVKEIFASIHRQVESQNRVSYHFS